jgi:hypothetical protein
MQTVRTHHRNTHDTVSNSHQLQEISSDWHKANKNTTAWTWRKVGSKTAAWTNFT